MMIGRVQERKELNRLYSRERAELVAIYGRRRVGKTYRLFASVFVNPKAVKSIVQLLYTRNAGFTRKEIIEKLGISGVITELSAWSKREDDADGTQIDLLISRNDNVMNMCEIKYYSGDFKVNKDYYAKILKRLSILAESVSPKMVIHSTLITTFGLVQNEYSGVFSKAIVLDDLFRDE